MQTFIIGFFYFGFLALVAHIFASFLPDQESITNYISSLFVTYSWLKPMAWTCGVVFVLTFIRDMVKGN